MRRRNRSPYLAMTSERRGISVASSPRPMVLGISRDPVLPQPNGAFAWVQAPPGPALVCLPLAQHASHVFTTQSWALGSRCEQRPDRAWNEVAQAMSLDAAALVRVRQVHGADVHVRRADGRPKPVGPGRSTPDADVILSDDPDRVLAIQTADCVPLLMVDARTGVAVAAHG